MKCLLENNACLCVMYAEKMMMDDWCPVKDKNSHEFWIRKDICSDTKEDF